MSVDEKRLEGIEVMVADLIRIVGNTNAMVEEIRDKVNGLENKVDGLESKVDILQDEVSLIKSAMTTNEDVSQLNQRLDLHMEKLGRQEEDIYRLKRLVGVK